MGPLCSLFLFKMVGNDGATATTTITTTLSAVYRFVVLIHQKLFQVVIKGKLHV